jgi:hypothetical protein
MSSARSSLSDPILRSLCEALLGLGPEEDEPNGTHHDHGQADTDDKQSQYGRAGFGLPGFRRSFNNDAVFLDGHIVLR